MTVGSKVRLTITVNTLVPRIITLTSTFEISDLPTLLPSPTELLSEPRISATEITWRIVCAQSLILAAGPNPASGISLNFPSYSGAGGNYGLEMVTNGRTKTGKCTKDKGQGN